MMMMMMMMLMQLLLLLLLVLLTLEINSSHAVHLFSATVGGERKKEEHNKHNNNNNNNNNWKRTDVVRNVRLYLKQRNIPQLEERLWEISDPRHEDYGRYLSVEELRQQIGSPTVSPSAVERVVVDWIEEALRELASASKKSETTTTTTIPPFLIDWRLSVTGDDIVLTQVSASLIEALFGVTLYNYHKVHHSNDDNSSATSSTATLIKSRSCPKVPTLLEEIVELVYGLCEIPFLEKEEAENGEIDRDHAIPLHPSGALRKTRRSRNKKESNNPLLLSVNPAVLYTQYNIQATQSSSHNHNHNNATAASSSFSSAAQSVAEFEEAYFFPEDLRHFHQRYGLLDNPVARLVGKNDPQEGYLAEASTDTQYASAVAPTMPLWVFSHPAFDLSYWAETVLNTTTTTTVAGGTAAPRVHSISWGSREEDFDPELLRRWNKEFLKLALAGHTVFVASGDRGVDNSGWFQCRSFRVQFPASSPYVTAVGGTSLVLESRHPQDEDDDDDDDDDDEEEAAAAAVVTKIAKEMAWEYSGGGFSNFFSRPPYQNQAVEHYLQNFTDVLPRRDRYNPQGRAVPDISVAATHYQVLMQGYWGNVSGTSAGAPVWAGLVTELNHRRLQSGMPVMGFLNPWLYQLSSNNKNGGGGGVGRDIQIGKNVGRGCHDGFPAVPGFDAVTGLGVPNHALLLEQSLPFVSLDEKR